MGPPEWRWTCGPRSWNILPAAMKEAEDIYEAVKERRAARRDQGVITPKAEGAGRRAGRKLRETDQWRGHERARRRGTAGGGGPRHWTRGRVTAGGGGPWSSGSAGRRPEVYPRWGLRAERASRRGRPHEEGRTILRPPVGCAAGVDLSSSGLTGATTEGGRGGAK